jgi:hypothetical protein
MKLVGDFSVTNLRISPALIPISAICRSWLYIRIGSSSISLPKVLLAEWPSTP